MSKPVPAERVAVADDGLRERLVRMRRELVDALDRDFDAGSYLPLLTHLHAAISATIRRVILWFTDAAKEPVDFEEAAFRDCYVKSLYEGALLARPILMRTAFERPHLLASSQPPEARRPIDQKPLREELSRVTPVIAK